MPDFHDADGGSGFDYHVTPRPSIDEVRRQLRKLGPDAAEWKRELKSANKAAADIIAATAQAKAQALGGIHARAAGQIKGSNVEKGIRIRVNNSKTVPFAIAALWGRKGRTGWYLEWTLRMVRLGYPTAGAPQFPEWVGASWKPGERGEGPYAVNDAIADKKAEVIDQWSRAIERIARDAGFK